MRKKKIGTKEENSLSTDEFTTYLENYQREYASDIPVILLIAKAKEISETDGESIERKIDVPQYGNTQMDAFYFYKPVSTIIINDD